MQPTPLRVEQDRAFLKALFGSTAFPIYGCGAADGQSVGPQPSSTIHFHTTLTATI
jgi:hypothetical protein